MDTVKVALVGNPNVGKSTLFNALTGLRQHTGNWPGKTVDAAVGSYRYRGRQWRLTDLPGLYSLQAKSEEERVAAAYIESAHIDCTVVVCDATCLARSLILALQVAERAGRAVICLNLCDEAEARGIFTDAHALSRLLGLPVVETSAGRREGLETLRRVLWEVCEAPAPQRTACGGEGEPISAARRASELAERVQRRTGAETPWRKKLDGLILSRSLGYPVAFTLLLLVLWLTVWGANYPGILLERLFSGLSRLLYGLFAPLPAWLTGLVLDGVFDTAARVVTVMLPPMAIFFPLFTLLEDFGLLPRLAFLLDRPFERCGACGKQALTCCMCLGCNAVGVTGCRIIDAPRERLLAVLTCAFLPCNGRFPMLMVLGTVLFRASGALSALLVALCLAVSMAMVLAVCRFLSATFLRGRPSGFVMELPPFRRPRVLQVLVRSLLDRTLFVLGRALAVAAPAGAVIWLGMHLHIAGASLLAWGVRLLQPLGALMGMSGAILLAFVLGFPANELVLPVLVMLLTGAQTLGADAGVAEVLAANGVGGLSAVCMLIFCLFHWPCGTTVLTVHRETGSLGWTALSILLPTLTGMGLCMLAHFLGSIL